MNILAVQAEGLYNMSRHTITVHSSNFGTDHEAIIAYDRPMHTYFLQAFQHPISETYIVWLGDDFEQHLTLEALCHTAKRRGITLDGITPAIRNAMFRETGRCGPR